MKTDYFNIESKKAFSESLIWQLNRDYYQNTGIRAWSEDIVPHHMTSNSKVGQTYAELIYAFLKDLAAKGKSSERVYILELGAGHGRLAFHILKHLQNLESNSQSDIPPYCYILSDIVEENLTFFNNHPQFQEYFKKGVLDVAYFDAIYSEELFLRNSKINILPKDLSQPILAVANYFFDSLPNDLFYIKDKVISTCTVSLDSKNDPEKMKVEDLIENVEISFQNSVLSKAFYEEEILNEILGEYRSLVKETYIFFPQNAIKCLKNLKAISTEGLILITMDKGFHEIQDLENRPEPDFIRHGSFSLWVNYHALSSLCLKEGGKVMFPKYSTFHLDIGCLLFLSDSASYSLGDLAYQKHVNEFGPDDFNSIKKLAYHNISRLSTIDLIALIRLSAYDSTFFINLLPRLKQVYKEVTFNERRRIAQTMNNVWDMYFSIQEAFDLAYEMACIFYDLGFYSEAIKKYHNSENIFGRKADISYNIALSYYQLKEDKLFYETLKEAKEYFPENSLFDSLNNLDMS